MFCEKSTKVNKNRIELTWYHSRDHGNFRITEVEFHGIKCPSEEGQKCGVKCSGGIPLLKHSLDILFKIRGSLCMVVLNIDRSLAGLFTFFHYPMAGVYILEYTPPLPPTCPKKILANVIWGKSSKRGRKTWKT